ncbi:uncharacterized protein C8orf76 homolog isoform X2 [Prinia subflava]|uniref:uncharacterized protein C8orf76 homolog isoform X2 n=1 Tax=Prinia subflava TaxID=208062 RepID=UPI002FE1A2CF
MEPALGPEFEDSLFAPSRERREGGGAAAPSGARHCEPRWFHSAADGGEGSDGLTSSKFRADWAFRQRHFERLGTVPCRTEAVTSPAPRGCGSPFSELPPLSDESCSGRQAPASAGLVPGLCRLRSLRLYLCLRECCPCLFCPPWSQASAHCVRPEPHSSSAMLSCLLQSQLQHKALCEYSECLLLLPASNIAMRRDVQEGQARCLSRLGRHKEALDIAEKMRNSATNTDHLTTVLNLQFSIYQDLENVEKKMMCLQQLICLHPFNPWFWKLLAEAYMSLFQSLAPLVIPEANLNQSEEVCVSNSSFKTSTGREKNLQPRRSDGQKDSPWFSLAAGTKGENAVTCPSSQVVTEHLCTSGELEWTDKEKCADSKSWKQNMLKKVGIKACASFIRARLLLQLTQSQQLSFVLENNRKGQKEIDDKVALLGFDENSLLLMTKAMGQDLIPEKLKEEFQGEVKCIGPSALSSLVTASVREFEIKWFDNLQDDLCHFDRQFY